MYYKRQIIPSQYCIHSIFRAICTRLLPKRDDRLSMYKDTCSAGVVRVHTILVAKKKRQKIDCFGRNL
jgi:hypothetical protein